MNVSKKNKYTIREATKYIPDDLYPLFGENVAILLSTFSPKGVPYASPIFYFYPHGRESILVTMHKMSPNYKNLIWQKRVSLTFMAPNNICYMIQGHAGLVRAPSYIHPLMHIVRIDITHVRSARTSYIKFVDGPFWKCTTQDQEDLTYELRKELEQLEKEL